MNDVVYEYGCEVTSTVECPLNEEIREKAIEECKEVVRQHWINGTVAHRIAEEIYGDLEKLKEQKNG